MVKILRFNGLVLTCLTACFTALVSAGCNGSNTGILQEAAAVQLETTLISMMDALLKTLVYNAMDIPGTLY